MDKEAVVHVYNGILLSHKKEQIWICSKEMDKPRAYYTDWSKSEREIWVSYTDTYIWNLKRWHWWIYFQGSNGETNIKNRPMDRMGGEEGEGEMYGESNIEIHNTICKIDSQWEFAVWLRDLKHGLCKRLKGEVGRKMGGRSGREGTRVYLWLILVDAWQKTTKFYKAITFQLKNNNKNFLFWTDVQWMPFRCRTTRPDTELTNMGEMS